MKFPKLLPFAFAALFLISSCSDSGTDPEPETVVEEKPTETAASASAIEAFHKSDAYYQLYVYRFDSTTVKWTSRIASHFSSVPKDEPAYLGFSNPYVVESGVNLFGMVTLYQEALGSNNIKEARINVEKVLQFFPAASGSKKGVVKVVAQNVIMRKKDGNPDTISIGISGEGTYDEETKVIDLIVYFNETSIGGKASVARKYKLSVDALTLN